MPHFRNFHGASFDFNGTAETADTIEFKATDDGAATTGDYNADGTVDGSDFLVWQRQVGTGDVNGDGLVDAADYTVWRDNLSVQHEDEIDLHDISWVL